MIGGGIGGLTTALALSQRGASVRVFEAAPALTAVGAGIQITPNGARVLSALGLADGLRAVSVASQAVIPMDALSGQALARFDLTGQRPRYRFMHRAALIELLATAAQDRGVVLTLGARVARNGEIEGHPDLDEADLVVFADGIRSVGRTLLNGAAEPIFTGQVAWRAVIAGSDDAVARIHMAPGRHVVTYPLGGDRLNLVAVQERAGWAAEGWSDRDDPANLRAAFADCDDGLRELLDRVEEAHLWGLFRHPVAECWLDGRIVLVGDAAHPTLPFLAQGANLALEDAFVLARRIAESGVRNGLQVYESERNPRVTRAIAAANANARNYHLSGPARWIAHRGLTALGKVAPNRFIDRLGWLYDHDVTA